MFKRGHRVRYFYRNLPGIVIGTLTSIFAIPFLVYLLREVVDWYEKGVVQTSVWYILAALLAFYVAAVALVYYLYRRYRYQSKFWGKLYKLHLVSKNLVNFGFYTETQKDGKSVVSYWPRVYLKFNGLNGFKLFLPLDGNKFQEQFSRGDFSSHVVTSTRATISEHMAVDGFALFEFLIFPLDLRFKMTEVKVTDHSIELMSGLVWNFEKNPHMLIAGDTGAGKSYFIFSLLSALLQLGADVRVADPKMTDIAGLRYTETLKGKVAYTSDFILQRFSQFYDDMMKRLKEYDKLNVKGDDIANYRSFGFKPVFFVFDEYGAFRESLAMKDYMKLESQMNQILMLGRQVGFFVIVGLQRPDADTLGKARDQFQTRVSLGKMKPNGLNMLFPDANPDEFVNLSKDMKGWGYIQMSPNQPRAFFSPEVPKNFKIKTYFNNLADKVPSVESEDLSTEVVSDVSEKESIN